MSYKELYNKDYFERHRKDMGYRLAVRSYLLNILKHKPKRVLDVGCGLGIIVQQLLEQGVDAYGIDCSEYAGGEIKDKNRFIVADANKLPFPDNSFDVVSAKDFFEHIPKGEIDQVYSEMKRVGKHIIALICYKNKPHEGHITIHPREWWEKKLPGCELV